MVMSSRMGLSIKKASHRGTSYMPWREAKGIKNEATLRDDLKKIKASESTYHPDDMATDVFNGHTTFEEIEMLRDADRDTLMSARLSYLRMIKTRPKYYRGKESEIDEPLEEPPIAPSPALESFSCDQAAKILGVTGQTIRNILKANPDIVEKFCAIKKTKTKPGYYMVREGIQAIQDLRSKVIRKAPMVKTPPEKSETKTNEVVKQEQKQTSFSPTKEFPVTSLSGLIDQLKSDLATLEAAHEILKKYDV